MVLENVLRFEKGFQSLRFHASLEQMMVSVRQRLTEHISQLPKAQVSDVGDDREEIGTAPCESELSDRTTATSSGIGDAAMPVQELAVTTADTTADHEPDRPSAVDFFLLQCNQNSTAVLRILRKHIWLAAGHKCARQFQYWQGTSAPAEFIALLRKKGLLSSDS